MNDCWNHIGVRGDGTCPELQQHAHCRNCPVYAAAGAQLLDRPAPAGYRAAWTDHLAKPAAVSTKSIRAAAMIFRVRDEWLALPAAHVREVVKPGRVHLLPHRRSPALAGLVNVRGELVPCITLSVVLGLEADTGPAGGAALSRALVVARDGERFVLQVDHVEGLHRHEPAALSPAPETLANARTAHVRQLLRWKERVVGLLEPDALWRSLQRGLS